MLESSFGIFGTLISPSGTRSPVGTGITLRCDPGSLSLSRHPNLCSNINRVRNPSRSRSPSPTRSP